MEATQLYVQTKKKLAKARNLEKRRKNDIFLLVILIILLVASSLGVFLILPTTIYVVVVIILWDKRPWMKIVRYEDISDLEVEYELTMQIGVLDQKIKSKHALTNDLYQNLEPRIIEQQIETKQQILDLDEEILCLIQEVFSIQKVLEHSESFQLLVMKQETEQEITCVKLHIEQLKKQRIISE